MKHRFEHLHWKKDQKRSADEMTSSVKKSLFFLFTFFLLLYPHYSPYSDRMTTWVSHLFSLYSFVVNQTLGIIHESEHGVCYILFCLEFVIVLNGIIILDRLSIGVILLSTDEKKLLCLIA